MKSAPPKNGRKNEEPSRYSWIVTVFFLALTLSALMSLGSETVLEGARLPLAVCILLLFILLGILFDVVGVAVTAADPRPFHSMAAHRERGAKESLMLLRNADRVSSICNDVVGDICGIVSGVTAAVIVTALHARLGGGGIWLSVLITALISALTIGGKALGKPFAIRRCKEVVFFVGRFLSLFRAH